MQPRLSYLIPALLSAAWLTPAANAQTTYVYFGTGSQAGKDFGALNLQTGSITFIGTSSEYMGGLGFGSNGTLCGLGEDGNLYSINVANGATTVVGPTGSGGESDWGMTSAPNGTLYAYQQGDNLYTINPATGAGTLIGTEGFLTDGNYATDAAGDLYATQGDQGNGLYEINGTTAASV